MKTPNKSLTIFTILTVALATWIAVNSMDENKFDDKDILLQVISVPPEENGFESISYLLVEDVESESIFSLDSGSYSYLKDNVHRDKWNLRFVNDILEKNKNIFEDVKASNSKSDYQVRNKEFNEDYSYPRYLFEITNLHLLKAKKLILDDDREGAYSVLKDILRFSNKVSQEKSMHQLSSYVGGMVMKSIILNWIHNYIMLRERRLYDYDSLLAVINVISPYEKDGLNTSFINSYQLVKFSLQEKSSETLTERYASYQNSVKKWEKYNEKDGDFGRSRPGLYEFMQVLFPRYYINPNKILRESAKKVSDMHGKSSDYCNNIVINYSKEYSNIDGHWTDIIAPGSLNKEWLMEDLHDIYFNMRCSWYFFVGATKVIVALHKYEKENKILPETIHDLVPGYLPSIPLDYYSGKPLLYSKEKQWVYALGANGEDDGGEFAGFSSGYCRKEPACYNNPTFPLRSN